MIKTVTISIEEHIKEHIVSKGKIPMNIKYGLNYLIDTLNISALDLSKHINVHRTLISKWKNGTRKIDVNSQYFEKLIEYIVNINEQQNLKILESLYSSIYKKEYNEKLSKKELADLVKDIILYDKLSKKVLRELKKDEECLYVTEISVYSGKESKTKAIINLLDKAENYTPNKNLIFLNDVLCDLETRQIFIEKILSLLKKGFKLELILLSMTDNSSLVFYLYPIIFNKNCKVYTYPTYLQGIYKSCIYILDKSMLVLDITGEEKNKYNYLTSVYADPATIEFYTNIAENLKEKSTLLLNPTGLNQILKHKKKFIHNQHNNSVNSCAFLYHLTPTYLCMDDSLFEEILTQSLATAEEVQIELELHKSRKQSFLKMLEVCDVVNFISFYNLLKYASMDKIIYPFPILTNIKNLVLSNSQFKLHIRNLIDLLKTNSNYKICLNTTNIFPDLDSFFLLCQKNQYLFMSDGKKNSTCLYTDDVSFVNSISNILEQKFFYTHSNYKEKDKVLEFLNSLL